MSDEPYTNLDLDTAENMLVAAGKPELATALRYQTQGIRNLVQGEWGQSFVNAIDSIMDTRVVSVLASVQQTLDRQHDLIQQLLVTAKNADTTARQALTVAKAGAARLGKLSTEVKVLKKALDESKEDRADLRKRIDAINARAEERQRLIDEHELLVREVAELKAWREAQDAHASR